ncbi:MAG TPA: CocE/NonD family hydrolase [Roseateles sp.]
MLLRASFLLFLGLSGLAVHADEDKPPAYEPREHYTKYEYRIPVRDGKKLFTAVYVPKDQSRRHPMLMTRTPYGCGPYGVDRDGVKGLAPSEDFLKAGYIFVCQDVRGRNLSEGVFIEMTPHQPVKKGAADVDESSDTHDSVQWLLDHVPGHNGRVGLWGISYPGFYTAASIIDSHPAIKAASPQAPIADLFKGDDSYHGGAFMLAANFGFYTGFKPQQAPVPPPKQWPQFDWGTLDGYEFYLQHGNLDALMQRLAKDGGPNPYFDTQLEHDRYDGFWSSRAITPHLKNIRAAVLTVGGWFDAEDLAGPFSIFRAIARQSPGTDNRLVVGPWVHGGWAGAPGRQLGRVQFHQPTSEQFQKDVLLPFFEQHLRAEADAKAPKTPIARATVFETGTNVWRRYDAWPPKEAKVRTLYFAPGGRLSFTPPEAAQPAFDSWVSDPAKPVPFVGYAALGVPQEYMVSDQRFAATRPDVLTYRSEVLEEDVTVAGPIVARLFASTSGSDADWVVKLIDVYPPELEDEAAKKRKPRTDDVEPQEAPLGGYQQLVRGDPLRGRFRHSFEKPEAMVPGQVEELRVELQDINHSFRRGHRIMVQVQSSWFPLIDRNPQTFVPIRSARPEDFQTATQKLYRWAGQASGLELRVMQPR